MKKSLCALAMFIALAMGVTAVSARDGQESPAEGNKYTNPAGNPVDQLTGEYWMKSAPEIKETFLFGVDNAITVNAIIAEKQADVKNGYRLSRFDKDWMEAFSHMSRKEIVSRIDAWYQAHPEDLGKSVMWVIWHQLIVPAVGKK